VSTPDARREDSFPRLRDWAKGLGRRAPRAPVQVAPAAGAPPASHARLDQLERLGRLREDGLLDAAEFQREKTKVLAEAPSA
jgi:Short C-terminal domain